MDAGMNVARFNMSHGTTDWHKATIQHLRHLSLKKQTPLTILVDLAGPKIRVGDLPKVGYLNSGEQNNADVILTVPSNQPKMIFPQKRCRLNSTRARFC